MKLISLKHKVVLFTVTFNNEQWKHLCISKVKRQVFLEKSKRQMNKIQRRDLKNLLLFFLNFWGSLRDVLAQTVILRKLTHLTFWLCSKAPVLAAFSAFPTFEDMRLPKAAGEKGWTKAVSSLGPGDRQRLSGCSGYLPGKGCCALALSWFFTESKCIAHLSCSSA